MVNKCAKCSGCEAPEAWIWLKYDRKAEIAVGFHVNSAVILHFPAESDIIPVSGIYRNNLKGTVK